MSTTESKYIAATYGGKKALWLHSLISEVFGPITSPTTLFSDNQAAITLMRDHQYHLHMKHIDMQCRERSSRHLEFQLSREQVLVNLP